MAFLFDEPHQTGASDKIWRTPWLAVAAAAALAAAGTGALYSVAGGSYEPWAERHALRFIVLMAVVLCMAVVPLRVWMRLAWPAYAVALVCLALVPLAGSEALGARRWIAIGGLSFQPSEPMKVALVLVLARYYHWLPPERISRPLWVAAPLALIAVPVLFVLKQPDLGSAMLFGVLGLSLLFLAGVSPLYYLGGAVAAGATLPVLLSRLHDYQLRRIDVFLNPESDPLGAGYHIMQSKIALGSGGVAGRGYMQGTQSQLDFLPEKHTDFIFTMIGEEWGFIGTTALLAVYALLLVMLMRMALRAASPFARLLTAGAAVTVFLYVFINVAMVTGLVPVVGVPLPLVSYGGTAMLTIMTSLGLAASAHVHGSERVRRTSMGPFF